MYANTFPEQAEATHSKYPKWFEIAEALATTPYKDSAPDAKDIIAALAACNATELYVVAKIATECGNFALVPLIAQIAEEQQHAAFGESEATANPALKFQQAQLAQDYSGAAAAATQFLFDAGPFAAADPGSQR